MNDNPTKNHLGIRSAEPADVALLAGLIRELAEYEKLEQFVEATPERLTQALFGPRPLAEAFIAESNGAAVGYAIAFMTLSTFRCQPALFLEDLFVQPQARGQGIGRALLAHVAAIAALRKCCRLEWIVLDWNAPAIDFYKSQGARPIDDWTTYRLEGPALQNLAANATTLSPEIAR